jgi:hypothetical protein
MTRARSTGVQVGEVVVRVYDLGPEPEWHKDRSLFGPWRRYVADVPELEALETAPTAGEAVQRLASMHLRRQLDTRWPAKGTDER